MLYAVYCDNNIKKKKPKSQMAVKIKTEKNRINPKNDEIKPM